MLSYGHVTRAAAVHTVCLHSSHMLVQAGTYIKEFVHSDEGRTQPNLASLLDLSTAAKILQLDVNHIHMEFLSDQQYNADLT